MAKKIDKLQSLERPNKLASSQLIYNIQNKMYQMSYMLTAWLFGVVSEFIDCCLEVWCWLLFFLKKSLMLTNAAFIWSKYSKNSKL